MNALRLGVCSAALLIMGAFAATAPAQQQRPSPPGIAGSVIDGDRVTIYYSRPQTRKGGQGEVRKIFGKLVPYGEVWRTGANEATLLVTQKDLQFGDKTVPAGAYTVWTIPTEDGGTFILNKQIGQWGEDRDRKKIYDEANDVLRVDMKKDTLDKPVDMFTITVAKGEGGGGVIKLAWENTQYSVPFTVKK